MVTIRSKPHLASLALWLVHHRDSTGSCRKEEGMSESTTNGGRNGKTIIDSKRN